MLKGRNIQPSNGKSYQIYALIDPRDNLVYYVGMSQNAHVRYYGHLNSGAPTQEEKHWIAELRQEGLSPTLQILESIEASDDSDDIVCERETLDK